MNGNPVIDLEAQRAAERRLAAFTGTLAKAPYFSAVGSAPARPAARAAEAYLAELGLDTAQPAWTADLASALSLIRRSDTDPAWRAAEDGLRAALTREIDALLGQSKAAHLLNEVMRQASEAATGAAEALAEASAEPEAVKRAAAGAVIQAAYEAALAHGADAPAEDPFRRKFEILAAGHWPLAVIGDSFHIY